ncbi:protein-L-isoaspartate O-methyltransferase [Dictyobacter sp. S3.2.2.5]|uniref:Protein-L-isoaspartate O-methyltransferase n=1 Tax=Dictyobacter halimunensis TaxID=3026934 RepID=A0ABQ6FJK3_9CHLR|nr:protein-L-isoaspartate O-methyltransferase [Dictyobacter sp. S3.2.2.5]
MTPIPIRSAQLRQQLVTTLINSGALHSPAITQAFLSIPREAFIPFFLEQSESPRLDWVRHEAVMSEPTAYLEQIYTDQPLVTKLDDRKMPASSSSLPSIMVKMLEALDMQPGHTALEVGTGTGYNAALLAQITGSPAHVSTIDVDPILTASAIAALEHTIGPGVTVIIGDGFQGYPLNAPYDRIIVTASIPTVPPPLIDQLAPGGKLVMDLQGSLASGFLVIDKTEDGIVGHFRPEPLHFMPLFSDAIAAPDVPRIKDLQQHDPCALPAHHPFPDILNDYAFRWFLQWRIPGCQVTQTRPIQRQSGTPIPTISVVDPHHRTIARFQRHPEHQEWTLTTYGSQASLWDTLLQAYHEFVSLGKPQPHNSILTVEDKQPMITIGSLKLPVRTS